MTTYTNDDAAAPSQCHGIRLDEALCEHHSEVPALLEVQRDLAVLHVMWLGKQLKSSNKKVVEQAKAPFTLQCDRLDRMTWTKVWAPMLLTKYATRKGIRARGGMVQSQEPDSSSTGQAKVSIRRRWSR